MFKNSNLTEDVKLSMLVDLDTVKLQFYSHM